MTQYLYPQNLKATANLWLWGLRDFCILGIAALLSMLNSCASGVSVVNIDNGFGAGYQASLINHLPGRTSAGAQR